uniref:NADH:flavin oxidoreductase/NADH oxidase N-terminal domain-containing protein n=1 Tax=Acrobeloides nanus TaxID=290746 RepID=A0A914CLM7_9BILA
MAKRVPVERNVDSYILGEKLFFPTSKRYASNRFLKAALTEKLCIYDKTNLQISGIPSERYINLYSKWGHGGFGVVLTGNIAVDQYHPEAPGNAIIEKSLDSKARREALKKTALAIKSEGSLAIVQLTHSGRQCYISVNEHPYSASDVQLQGVKFIGGMVNAIKEEVTDGIGLGRPITAEPDLPKKILLHGIQSALASPFENDLVGTDFGFGLLAANSQMWQAGELPYEETNGDPCYGIMDISIPKVVDAYAPAAKEFLQVLTDAAEKGP